MFLKAHLQDAKNVKDLNDHDPFMNNPRRAQVDRGRAEITQP